jgi:hypothetical protein
MRDAGWHSDTAIPMVPLCHRYTGTTPSPPPGSHYTSPSENMWNTGSTYNLSSGMAVAGESLDMAGGLQWPAQNPSAPRVCLWHPIQDTLPPLTSLSWTQGCPPHMT